jgi:hypothetical protein
MAPGCATRRSPFVPPRRARSPRPIPASRSVAVLCRTVTRSGSSRVRSGPSRERSCSRISRR